MSRNTFPRSFQRRLERARKEVSQGKRLLGHAASRAEALLDAAINDPATVPDLLAAGANPNIHGWTTPLLEALRRNHSEAAEALLAAGARWEVKWRYDGDDDALEIAIKYCPDAVPSLLRAGAPVEGRSGCRMSPLMWAASCRSTAMPALLAAGADVHARLDDGTTALHCAVTQGAAHERPSRPTVLALLAAGAAVGARDKKGRSALMLAAESGDDGVEVLLEAGANTADLHEAARHPNASPRVREWSARIARNELICRLDDTLPESASPFRNRL